MIYAGIAGIGFLKINQLYSLLLIKFLNFSLQNFDYTRIEYIILINLSTSFLGTLLLIPLVKKFGEKFNIIDIPNKRKLHTNSIVRLGGIAIFIGFVIGLLSVLFTGVLESYSLENISAYGRILLFMATGIFFLGLFDDLFNLSPRFRLFFQFLIASITWVNNLSIDTLDFSYINPNFYNVELPATISYLITVFWIVGIINAFNWIDGADGLAAGLFIIASFSFLIIEYTSGVQYLTCILASVIGPVVAFFIFNYNPAKILMGDSGSYFLGFNLSIASFISSTDADLGLNSEVVLLIMFIPIIDMVYVIFNRIKKGKSPFIPDKTHLHHRLLESGLNQKETVKIIWGLAIILSIFALVIKGIFAPIFIFYSFILYIFFDIRIKRFLKRLLFPH